MQTIQIMLSLMKKLHSSFVISQYSVCMWVSVCVCVSTYGFKATSTSNVQ